MSSPIELVQLIVKFAKKHKIVLKKSAVSALTAAIGNLIAQRAVYKTTKRFVLRDVIAFAVFGFAFTGPITHNLYAQLEQWFPRNVPNATLKKLLVERLLFQPGFILLFLSAIGCLQGKSIKEVSKNVNARYIPTLIMNWKVWTPAQIVNLSVVPLQYRVFFANMVALVWNAYLSMSTK
eukprot:Colp12_sorted_trinity150504_noHs@29